MPEKPSEIPGFDLPGFLSTLTQRPGVYRMLDARSEILYIGKAKNLRKRVASYFGTKDVSPKQQAMVAQIRSVEVTVTHTEGEALLLESQLIKRHKPRYNICLRDDKSYPYIYVSSHQDFPRVGFHRGAKNRQGRYFGPFPSAGAVRESLRLLQKIFPVRQCEDSVFRHRSRPCLQYQIKRCTAPCVGLDSVESYRRQVEHTMLFLQGDGSRIIGELVEEMEQAAARLEFEKAAGFRDQIAILRQVLEKQYVHGERGDLDIIACASGAGIACVRIVYVRKGQHIGDKSFFPKLPEDSAPAAVLEAFIPQYYLEREIPREILVSHETENHLLLEHVLSTRAGTRVAISTPLRGSRLKWMELASNNAQTSLNSRLADKQGLNARFFSLKEELGCAEMPKRLECFDISHTRGDQTVASCVVFDADGPVKSAYRRFNIEGINPGDDYAAMAQVVKRRFKRIQAGETEKPDILFIDGGKGQIHAVGSVLEELEIADVMVIGVAKGPSRKSGMEQLYWAGDSQPITMMPDAPARLLIQQIRDEAHRFAITGHRQRRGRSKKRSVLEEVAGLGPKRRQVLLKQFGGLQEISRAGVEALCGVEGISRQLAQRIYDTFHS
ncbi:MAG: excinuclease ABC subunit UvrC [Gammaproteobacteria bacterium]